MSACALLLLKMSSPFSEEYTPQLCFIVL
jgi:hypothetical protein